MSLSEDLLWRGLIKDKTFTDPKWLDEPRTFYLGIDASADSLTVGNLAIILMARRLSDAGWKTVLLMGGGTSLVGDPGGKTQERQLMSREVVQKNIGGIQAQVTKLFSGEKYEMLDNYDWLSGLKYVDFLREVGKHFSMTELMQREFVIERVGVGAGGISYAEFSYSLVQGYDFWHLFNKHGVQLQIGGSDQWGNMLSGVSLIRKKESKEAHAVSMPLVVNKETGQKFGKSEGGAVWLDPAKTTETDFHKFWVTTGDGDVENYLKMFTLLPKNRIEEVMAKHHENPSKQLAQKELAEIITKLVHGEPGVLLVNRYLNMVSASPSASVSPSAAPPDDDVEYIKLNSGIGVVEAMVKTRLAESNSEARRVVDEGGVYVDNKSFKGSTLKASDYTAGRLILRRGKKLSNSALVELE